MILFCIHTHVPSRYFDAHGNYYLKKDKEEIQDTWLEGVDWNKVYMLGAKNGFAQSVDCPAQSVDPCFALATHGMTHDCAIPGLHTHDERAGPLLATLLVW